MSHQTSYQDAISLLTRQTDGGVGLRGYGAALGLVAGARSAGVMRDHVSGFFTKMENGFEFAIKAILFLVAAVLVIVVLK